MSTVNGRPGVKSSPVIDQWHNYNQRSHENTDQPIRLIAWKPRDVPQNSIRKSVANLVSLNFLNKLNPKYSCSYHHGILQAIIHIAQQ